jgi:probable addiction module antidote protein
MAKITVKKVMKHSTSHDDFMKIWLTKPKHAAAYLEAAIEEYLESSDMQSLMRSLKMLADVKGGIGSLAKKTGLGRESLYKTLSGKVEPKFSSVIAIMGSLGIRMKPELRV